MKILGKNQMSPAIHLKNLHLHYQNNVIFNGFSWTVTGGKCTCLLGPSGSGKTTLLQLIAGLIKPAAVNLFQGEIYSDIPNLTQQIAYMAQNDLLLPWLNALDNSLLGMKLRNAITPEKTQQATQLFSQLGLAKALKKFPHELSGGMRQRVALIRTLLEDKPIVLMDEPFSAVDAITRFELQNIAAELLRDKTVLLVTHDPIEALRIADEIIILSIEPARIQASFSLSTSTPRNLANSELILYQSSIYEALTNPKKRLGTNVTDI